MHHHFNLLPEIVTVIQTLAWPIVVLTIFLILKTPIKSFINRIKEIGYNGTHINAGLPSKQEGDTPIEKLSKDKTNASIDKILNLFSPKTIEELKTTVIRESNLDAFVTPDEREKVLLSYSQVIYLIMHFNKIYNSIYGSQIRILQRLKC